jgi:hypothetical protein
MTLRLRSLLTAGALGATSFLLTSCTAPHPTITFYGDRASVTVEPELWCTINATALTVACPPGAQNTGNDGVLTMGTNRALQINLPGDVAGAPWFVTYAYRDAAGKVQTERSAVISDGRLSFTLPGRGPGAQLLRVEVDSGLVPTQAADGSTVINAARVWVLAISPKAAAG